MRERQDRGSKLEDRGRGLGERKERVRTQDEKSHGGITEGLKMKIAKCKSQNG
jgi:hypothetical protein